MQSAYRGKNTLPPSFWILWSIRFALYVRFDKTMFCQIAKYYFFPELGSRAIAR